MKPLSETPRYPSLNTILLNIVTVSLSCTLLYLYYEFAFPISEQYIGTFSYVAQLVLFLTVGSIATATSIIVLDYLAMFAINHLSGRNLFGDKTPANSMFADAYAISSAYVLPYAYHSTNKRGDHFCDLYLSFSYAEILHIYQTLAKRHRLTYYFRTLSLPSHLGRRMPLLTRAGAKQLLREMHNVADASGETVQQQRAVLLYTFYPHYSDSAELPEHQAFISRDIIRELLNLMNPTSADTIPANAEIDAFYDAENVIALSAGYLRATYARIASEDEFVYLPISPA